MATQQRSRRADEPMSIDDIPDGFFQETNEPPRMQPAVVEPPKSRNLLAVANDTVIEAANAAAGGVSAAANFIKPGNAVSQWIDRNIIQAGEQSQSDVVKASKKEFHEEVKNAAGVMGELGAVGRYIAQNPLLAAAQAAGSFALPMGAVKGAQAAARAAGVVQKAAPGATALQQAVAARQLELAGVAGGVTAGAAMAGGDAAGSAYDLAIKAGATPQEATAAARQASVIPAVVGGLGGALGAEKLLAGAKGFGGGAAARAVKTGLSEAAQEAVEEGVTQYEGQRAAVPFDPGIDPSKGVAAAAGMGAALGGMTGAGTSLLSGGHERQSGPAVDDAEGAGRGGQEVNAALLPGLPVRDAAAADGRSKAGGASGAPGLERPDAGLVSQGDLLPQQSDVPQGMADEAALPQAGVGSAEAALPMVNEPVVPVPGVLARAAALTAAPANPAVPVVPAVPALQAREVAGVAAVDADAEMGAASDAAYASRVAVQQAPQVEPGRTGRGEGWSPEALAGRDGLSQGQDAPSLALPVRDGPAPADARQAHLTDAAGTEPVATAYAEPAQVAPTERVAADIVNRQGKPFTVKLAAIKAAQAAGAGWVPVPVVGGYVARQVQPVSVPQAFPQAFLPVAEARAMDGMDGAEPGLGTAQRAWSEKDAALGRLEQAGVPQAGGLFSRAGAQDQTGSEAFKRWYGDWQNAGDEATTTNSAARSALDAGDGTTHLRRLRGQEGVESSADRRDDGIPVLGGAATFNGASGPTGAGGAPLRLYHGTRDDITAFDLESVGHDRGSRIVGRGVEHAVRGAAVDSAARGVANGVSVQRSQSVAQDFEHAGVSRQKGLPRAKELAADHGAAGPERQGEVRAGEGSASRAISVGPLAFTGASGPVDTQGKPVRFYHGTRDDFSVFDIDSPGRKDQGWLGDGIYLTTDAWEAAYYAGAKRGLGSRSVMPLYANVRNPFVATEAMKQKLSLARKGAIKAFTQNLKKRGYDGVVLDKGEAGIELVAFEPTQVKSATGNNGNFDPANPDIRYRRQSTNGAAGAAQEPARYSSGLNEGQAFSQRQAEAVSRVRATADAIRRGWANGPEVVVVPDMRHPAIPEAVRQAEQAQRRGGAEGAAEGFYADGKVYLLASQLATAQDVARVLMHEALGHHGLRGVFGTALNSVLEQIVAVRRGDVRRKAVEYGLLDVQKLDGVALKDATAQQIWNAMTPEQRLQAAEEVLAEWAQSRPEMGFVRRAVAAVRSWLRQHMPGFKSLAWTDAELIRHFILPARAWVERGGAGGGNKAGATFSRKAVPKQRVARNFLQARQAVKEFQGKPLTNTVTGMQAVVSRKTLDKMLSSKAVAKSESATAHATAVANVDHLFEQAIWGWSKPDRAADTNFEAIHRFFAPMAYGDKQLLVKLTVKEVKLSGQSNPLYTVEAVELNESKRGKQWMEQAMQDDGLDSQKRNPLQREWADEIAGEADPNSTLAQPHGMNPGRSAEDVLSLAQAVERSNTDGPMFSRSEPAALKHSALPRQEGGKHTGRPGPTVPATVQSVRAAVRELLGGVRLRSGLGRVVVATSGEIRSQWEPLIGPVAMGAEADGQAQGFYDPQSRTVFLIADHIQAGDELGVVAHELMHKHGQAVLGPQKWAQLHGVIEGWADAPAGSTEQQVYVEAQARVRASRPQGVQEGAYSSQELFPYAVQVALELGLRPNGLAGAGTVERWLSQVRSMLRQAWNKLAVSGADFNALDLVNLAFGIAQRENPATVRAQDPARQQLLAQAETAMRALSEEPGLFALPRSQQKTVAAIAAEHNPGIALREIQGDGEVVYLLTMPDGMRATITAREPTVHEFYGLHEATGQPVTQRPGEKAPPVGARSDVWIDVSQLKPGSWGAVVYNIGATFAHNTGRIFIGDPAGLSDEAMVRRPEQMLSSALKFGTTAHLAPHPRQVVGDAGLGVPPLRWVYGDDAGNMARLVDLSQATLDNAYPAARDLTYDLDTGLFSNITTGQSVDPTRFDGGGQRGLRERHRAGLGSGADGAGDARILEAARHGWRTAARGAVFRALLERWRRLRALESTGGGSVPGSGRGPLLDGGFRQPDQSGATQNRDLGRGSHLLAGLAGQGASLSDRAPRRRIFYSRRVGGQEGRGAAAP